MRDRKITKKEKKVMFKHLRQCWALGENLEHKSLKRYVRVGLCLNEYEAVSFMDDWYCNTAIGRKCRKRQKLMQSTKE